MLTAGIDAGSRAVKIVLLDADDGTVAAWGIDQQGVQSDAIARRLFERLLHEAGRGESEVDAAVATGYARAAISFAGTTVTEITCHARGVHEVAPEARTVVEIGGQDSKLLRLDDRGTVRDFSMNDRCAAGTGRFLEVIADRLGVSIERLGEMAAASASPVAISSMCIVFAETEIIGLLASGTPPEDIVSGVQNSIAARIASMAGRELIAPVAFAGGVALVPGMDAALVRALRQPVSVVPRPQFTGALGAALIAARR